MMSYIYVLLFSAVSVFVMFIIAKIIGYRQISEISMVDYINSITLGSIAAELAIFTDIEKAIRCLIAMAVFGFFTVLFAILSIKSKIARRILAGEPIILMHSGKLFKNSFKKARLDIDEFLSMCRVYGHFDISKVDTVILEPTGKLSIIPKSSNKPLTPEDMKLPVQQEGICADIIKDGKVQNGNLRRFGLNEKWLKENLKLQGINSAREVFLASVDNTGALTVFKYENKKADNPL
jgi:uncharacterized membrane protein YcaP (DUF421 family)